MRRFFTFILCLLILSLGFSIPSYSGEWRDAFDGEKLKGWTLISKDVGKDWNSTWELKNGKLNVTLNLPAFLPMVADFLYWTAHQINTNNLIVSGRETSGWLCLFLGKRMLEPQFATGYNFCIGGVGQIMFDKKGNRIDGNMKAGYGDRAQLTSSLLKVIFDSGRFRVFGLEVLLADFEDAEFQKIEVVGILAIAGGGNKGTQGSINTFSISGPGIPVIVLFQKVCSVVCWVDLWASFCFCLLLFCNRHTLEKRPD